MHYSKLHHDAEESMLSSLSAARACACMHALFTAPTGHGVLVTDINQADVVACAARLWGHHQILRT